MSRSKRIVHLAALAAALGITGGLHSAPFTWDGGSAATNNWQDGLNWTGNVAPPLSDLTTDIFFAGTVRPTPIVDAPFTINRIEFSPGAAPFTISGSTLTIGAGGISNNDDANQSTNTSIVLAASQTWSSGVLSTTGGLQFNSPGGTINTNANILTLNALNGSSINVLTPLAGTGGITKDGNGTLIYAGSGSNTYTGTTTVNAGTLALNKTTSEAALAGPLLIGDGTGTDTVRLDNNNQIDVVVTINSSGLLDFVARTDSIPVPTLAGGIITGTSASNMIFTGSTPFASLASSSTATISVGSLGLNFPAARVFDIENGAAAVDLEISSAISNTASGGITKTGAGSMRFSGATANTYTGSTFVMDGTLLLAKSGPALAINGPLHVGSTATSPPPVMVRLEGTSAQINGNSAVTLNRTGTLDLGGSFQVLNNLTFAGGGLIIGPGGTARLNGTITTTPSDVAANISGAGVIDHFGGMRTWTVDDGTVADDLIVASTITNGGITKFGPGTMVLSGTTANTHALVSEVFEGTLILRKTAGINAVNNLTVGDELGGVGADVARLEASEQINDIATVSVGGTGLLDVNGHTETFFNLQLAGGVVNVNSGTLKFDRLTTIGNASSAINGPGTIDLAASTHIFTVNDGVGAVDLDISTSVNNGAVLKTGQGTLQYSGSSHNNAQSTTINQGTLILNKTGQELVGSLVIGDGEGGLASDLVRYAQSHQIAGTTANTVTINSSGRLDLNGFIDLIGPVTMSGGSIVTGAGTLSLNTTVTTLANPASAIITGNISLAGATVGINVAQGSAPIDLDIPANIAQGSINKSGLGTLRLSGTNTNNFTTLFLDEGELLIAGNSAAPLSISLAGGTIAADGAARTLNSVILSGDGAAGGAFDLTFNNVSATGRLTKNGSATLNLPNPTTLFGRLTINAGTLNAANLTASNDVIHNGGTFTGKLTNQGNYTSVSGNFAGLMINHGAINFETSFSAGGGIENYSQIEVGTGQTLATGGSGLDNFSTFHLTGGTIAGAPFTNDFGGRLEARGTVSTFFTNNGDLQTTGLLTLGNGGENFGVVSVSSSQSLRLLDDLGNRGVIQLFSGSVSGSGHIINSPGGQVQGSGGIANLENSGGLIYANSSSPLVISNLAGNTAGGELRVADEATLNVISPVVSSGTIVLQGPNASLNGGNVTNSGTISGRGRISNSVNNNGVIRAEGGLLTLSGAAAVNAPTGSIQAPTGGTIFYSQGLAINEGTIALSGGTFDNNARAISNTGVIDGRGIFRSGTLTNQNKINIADGATEFFGDVINNGSLTITNTTGTFFNNVTNNASGTIKTTSAVSRFLGTFTNAGIFLSDPSDNHFENLTLSETGILIGGWGDRFFVSGDVISASTAADKWDTRLAELILQGAGVHDLSVNGDDLGITFDGYENNFAWGKLLLGAGNRLALLDGDDQPGGAIYVRSLILAGGLSQISSIESNGLSIYYDLGDPSNAYLGGATYALSGGGQIAAVPEPFSASLSIITSLGLLRRTRRPREAGQ